jgi:hypothetical protein
LGRPSVDRWPQSGSGAVRTDRLKKTAVQTATNGNDVALELCKIGLGKRLKKLDPLNSDLEFTPTAGSGLEQGQQLALSQGCQ